MGEIERDDHPPRLCGIARPVPLIGPRNRPKALSAEPDPVFAAIEATLAEAGGKPSDMVTMTAFLTDVRNQRRFTDLRREILGKDFPASAAIGISHLANPNALLEIQAVAVVA